MMEQAALDAFLVRIKSMDAAEQVKLYVALRAAKAKETKAYDNQQAQYKQIMECCTNHMLARTIADGTTGFKTEFGTVYTADDVKISISDDVKFSAFVIEQADIGFLERRVSSLQVANWMKDHNGEPPPGLNIFREKVARVRKAGEK